MLQVWNRSRSKVLADLASKVAARSQTQSWGQVEKSIQQMVPDVAQGYVRARSGPVILREFNLATHGMPLAAAEEKRVIEIATDRLVEGIMAKWSEELILTMSQRPLRRAA